MVKIKGDDREDLKVLATGVAATLASRKVFHHDPLSKHLLPFFFLSFSVLSKCLWPFPIDLFG